MEGGQRPRNVFWTDEEDELLVDAVERHGLRWDLVVPCIPNRNMAQCRARYYKLVSRGKLTGSYVTSSRHKWTDDEDNRLVDAVERLGRQWGTVAACFHNRTGNACERRYKRLEAGEGSQGTTNSKLYLWTSKEDKVLLDAVERHGRNWDQVVAYLPGRTGGGCRNRYSYIQKGEDLTKLNVHWTAEEDKLLLDAMEDDVDAVDRQKSNGYWERISTHIPEKSARQCSNRFCTLHRVRKKSTSTVAKPSASNIASKKSQTGAPSSSLPSTLTRSASSTILVGESLSSPIDDSWSAGPETSNRHNPSAPGYTGVATTTTTATTKVSTNRADRNNNNNNNSSSSSNNNNSSNSSSGNHCYVQEDELAKLKGKNKSLREKKVELKQALKSALAEAAKWKADAERYQKIMITVSEATDIKDAKMASLTKEVTDVRSDSEAKIQQLQAQLADAVGTINTLKSEKESATSGNQHEILQLRKEVAELVKTVEQLQQEKEVAMSEKAEKESTLADSKRQSRRQISSLRNEIVCITYREKLRLKAELKAEEVIPNESTNHNNPSTLTGAEEPTGDGNDTTPSTFQSSSSASSQSLPSNHVADSSSNNTHANSDNDFEASPSPPKRRRWYPNAVDL